MEMPPKRCVSNYYLHKLILFKKKKKVGALGGSVKCLTLRFSWDCDLRVLGLSPKLGSVLSGESA